MKMGNRRNARPVKTANRSTDQMKQMYRLRVPRMFPKDLKVTDGIKAREDHVDMQV